MDSIRTRIRKLEKECKDCRGEDCDDACPILIRTELLAGLMDEIESLNLPAYQYETYSMSAPLVSDTDSGFVRASDPMAALKKVVEEYSHPCGLYGAVIKAPTPENPTLARYLSAQAATVESGAKSVRQKDGKRKVVWEKERYELVEE